MALRKKAKKIRRKKTNVKKIDPKHNASSRSSYYSTKPVRPPPVSCSLCDYTCRDLYNLEKHMSSNLHPKAEEYVCYHCEKSYYVKASLKKHILKFHIGIRVWPKGNTYGCPFCQVRMRRAVICQHFTTKHEIDLKYEKFTFGSYDKFKKWKSYYEEDTASSFVPFSTNTLVAGGGVRDIYNCYALTNPTGKRMGKEEQRRYTTCNLCPANLNVITYENGTVKAVVCRTHVGHPQVIGEAQPGEDKRLTLARKMAGGMTFDEILKEINTSNPNCKFNSISRNDLKSIAMQYGFKPEQEVAKEAAPSARTKKSARVPKPKRTYDSAIRNSPLAAASKKTGTAKKSSSAATSKKKTPTVSLKRTGSGDTSKKTSSAAKSKKNTSATFLKKNTSATSLKKDASATSLKKGASTTSRKKGPSTTSLKKIASAAFLKKGASDIFLRKSVSTSFLTKSASTPFLKKSASTAFLKNTASLSSVDQSAGAAKKSTLVAKHVNSKTSKVPEPKPKRPRKPKIKPDPDAPPKKRRRPQKKTSSSSPGNHDSGIETATNYAEFDYQDSPNAHLLDALTHQAIKIELDCDYDSNYHAYQPAASYNAGMSTEHDHLLTIHPKEEYLEDLLGKDDIVLSGSNDIEEHARQSTSNLQMTIKANHHQASASYLPGNSQTVGGIITSEQEQWHVVHEDNGMSLLVMDNTDGDQVYTYEH